MPNFKSTYKNVVFHMLDHNAAVMETKCCYRRPSKRCNAVQHTDYMTNQRVSLTDRSLTYTLTVSY